MSPEDQVRDIAERHNLDAEAIASIVGRGVETSADKLKGWRSNPRKWTRRDLERIAAKTGERIIIGDGQP